MKQIALLSLACVGCSSMNVPPCQSWQANPKDAWPVLTIDDGSLEGPVTVQLSIPSKARFGDGTPAVVFLHGGWRTDQVPVATNGVLLRRDLGFVTIYLNLPGGTGPMSTPGMDDRRGPEARSAVALALRYGAGELVDSEDCTLDDRVPDGLAETRVIAGMSNGGNLAWATAADRTIDLPQIDGIATFETPSASQFIMVEPGTQRSTDGFFDPETCALDKFQQIACTHGYGTLHFDPQVDPDTDGSLFVDDNDDGRRSSDDVNLGVVWSTRHDAWVHATPAREAAESQGITLSNRANIIDTRRFWLKREAPPNVAAAAERYRTLAAIATGTEQDHVLKGLDVPVHVTGLMAAMQAGGVHWSRLHADASYVQAISGLNRNFADIPSTTHVAVYDPNLPAQPEEGAQIRSTDYLTAAVIELLDRARLQRWDADIDAPLVTTP